MHMKDCAYVLSEHCHMPNGTERGFSIAISSRYLPRFLSLVFKLLKSKAIVRLLCVVFLRLLNPRCILCKKSK